MENLLELLIFSIVVGFAGGYAGIGGAPLLVAALVMALGYDQRLAQGTLLAVMLGPMSLPGVLVMWDRAKLLWRYILVGVLGYALCSNVGARLAFSLESGALEFLFGLLLIFLGAKYLWRRSDHEPIELSPDGPSVGGAALLPFTLTQISIASAVTGVVGGLFGIGAGVLLVPILVSLFDLHKDDARTLSLAILLPPVSIGAILEYQAQNSVDWPAAGVIFLTYFATNYSGAKLGRRHSPQLFLRILGILLALLGGIAVLTILVRLV